MLPDAGDDGVLPRPTEDGEELPAQAGQGAGGLLRQALIQWFVQTKSTDVRNLLLLSSAKSISCSNVW